MWSAQSVDSVLHPAGAGWWFYLCAFISSLEPLLEGLLAEIHMDLGSRGFGKNRFGDLWWLLDLRSRTITQIRRMWIRCGRLKAAIWDFSRDRKTDTFIVSYLYLVYSVMSINLSHVCPILRHEHWFFYSWVNIIVWCQYMFLVLIVLVLYHEFFLFSSQIHSRYLHIHMHDSWHTYKRTHCTISAHKDKWQEPSAGPADDSFLLRNKISLQILRFSRFSTPFRASDFKGIGFGQILFLGFYRNEIGRPEKP